VTAEPIGWDAIGPEPGVELDDNTGLAEAARATQFEWFEATDTLTQIKDFAHSLMINPWAAMLGVLVRYSADIPPTVVLPGLNGGSRGSLNLYGVFAGKSGAGKSDLLKAIDEWFLPRPLFMVEDPVVHFSTGTGEGIAARFVQMRKPEGSAANAAMVPTQVAYQALLEIDEISMLDKLAERSGQTLVDTLKTMWTGGRLAPGLADPTRQRSLDAHSYRLSLYMGAQPGLGRVLFSKESKLGGFVQRFLFATLRDPQLKVDDIVPPPPEALVRRPHPKMPFPIGEVFGGPGIGIPGRNTWTLDVDPRITQVLLDETLKRRTGDEHALDGHILFTKLRVAAVLAVMHGHDSVDFFWWELAEGVMIHSENTREALIRAISEEAKAERIAKARDEGEMDLLREEPKIKAAGDKFGEIARRHRAAHDGCSRKCFTAGVSAALRVHYADAIEYAVKNGLLVPMFVEVSRNGTVSKWKAP